MKAEVYTSKPEFSKNSVALVTTAEIIEQHKRFSRLRLQEILAKEAGVSCPKVGIGAGAL